MAPVDLAKALLGISYDAAYPFILNRKFQERASGGNLMYIRNHSTTVE
jgi:hypothetical protein